MGGRAGVVNVFAKPYEVWTRRDTTPGEMFDLVNSEGMSPSEALQVKDKLVEVVSTHTQAAALMLRERADNCLDGHINRALDSSAEYRALRDLMPQDVPNALDSYQGEFLEHEFSLADAAIKTHGVELAEDQILFHGGRWGGAGHTLTTSRPFSTSFCPQAALRNAEWGGKAYDAGRVDLMVVRVRQPKTKAYAYGRKGNHGHEKEVVFASGADLTCVRETYIVDIPVSKSISGVQMETKTVPAYVIEVEIR